MPAPADLETGDSFIARGRDPRRARHAAAASCGPVDHRRARRPAPRRERRHRHRGGAGHRRSSPRPARSVTALLRVEVAPPRADDIVIEPMSEPLHVGDEIRLEATPKDKRGWPVYRPVTWHSADPARRGRHAARHHRGPGLRHGPDHRGAGRRAREHRDPGAAAAGRRGGHRRPADVGGGGPDVRPHRDAARSREQPAARAAPSSGATSDVTVALATVGRLGGRAPAGRGRADGHLRGGAGLGADRRGRRGGAAAASSPRSGPPLAGVPGAGAGAACWRG